MKSKFTWIFTLLLAFFIQFSFAQEKTVTGTVTSASDGFPIPGVNVMVRGTTSGVQTGIDGKYSITAPVGSTLEFTYVGMKTVSQVVGASNSISVTMEDDAAVLEEVVVVAYGVAKKESITGSIGEIKAEQIATITTGNILQGTVGKVAGVQVFSNNGLPGDAPTIRMRGIGSINANADPLYVVDGIPFNGDIAMINGMDVESMTFLKDASAAALYGNRGANGVIIVTTKKGRNQKSTVTIDTRTGFSSLAVKDYDMVRDQREYYEKYYTALRNTLYTVNAQDNLTAATYQAAAELINGNRGLGYNAFNVPDDQLIDPVTGRVTGTTLKYDEDYRDYLFSNGLFTQTNFNIAGGNDKTTHFFSAGYERNEGYVVNSGLEKISSRAKIDTEVTDFLKSGINMSYTHLKQDYLDGYQGDTTFGNPFFFTRTIAPIYPVYLYDRAGNPIYDPNSGAHLFDDGQTLRDLGDIPVRNYASLQNPYATSIYDIKEYKTDNLFVSAYVDLKLYDGLTFTYTATGDLWAQGDRSLDTPFYGDAADFGGRVQYDQSRRLSVTQQQLLRYNKVFGKHGVDLLLGHETLDRRIDFISAQRQKLLVPDKPYVDNGATYITDSGNGSSYVLEGFFSRLSYDYNNKYYVNASIRRDGSSRFHPDNRWGTFYGLGGAWRLSQESFLQDVSWINELRVKASFGEQGNDNLGLEMPYERLYTLTASFNDDDPFNIVQSTRENPEITWETNTNFNIGFDTRLFNNRFSFEAEYFERRVTDMLYFEQPAPSVEGTLLRPVNLGDMNNKGFEVTITADVIKLNDLTVTLNANATHYKNEITRLKYNGQVNNRQVDGLFAIEEGGGRYDYYLREYAGVNRETGAALYWADDTDNPGQRKLVEGTANATLYKSDKSALPDVYGGFGLNVDYKGFDLGMQMAYQLGGYGYDAVWISNIAPGRGSNMHKDFDKTWTPENKDASLPIAMVEDDNQYYGTSTLGLIKSDYLSIQNLTLGYTFNKDLTDRIGLSSLRIYGLMDNVALWSRRQGFDPRVNGVTGTSDYNYSLLRTTSLGLNIQF